jgi:hypothetical protein
MIDALLTVATPVAEHPPMVIACLPMVEMVDAAACLLMAGTVVAAVCLPMVEMVDAAVCLLTVEMVVASLFPRRNPCPCSL